MPLIHAVMSKSGTGYVGIISAKRIPWSMSEWAEATIDQWVSESGSSTDPASGPNGPFTHTVVYMLGGSEGTAEFEAYSTQQELDDAVAAFKSVIVAAGGTITSG